MFDFLKSDICLYLLMSAKLARVLIHIYVDNAVAPALAGGAHYEAGCLHDALQGQRGPRVRWAATDALILAARAIKRARVGRILLQTITRPIWRRPK